MIKVLLSGVKLTFEAILAPGGGGTPYVMGDTYVPRF